jgi:hypothetical protein
MAAEFDLGVSPFGLGYELWWCVIVPGHVRHNLAVAHAVGIRLCPANLI